MDNTIDAAPIVASFSLYAYDLRKLCEAIDAGRAIARKGSHAFTGASFDVDSDGTVFVHIAGVETITL